MLSAERKRLIGESISRDGRVVASELSHRFKVSEDTIRRDLREMAADGLLHRVHGGALSLPKTPIAATYADRVGQAPAAKAEIAHAVTRLFRNGQVIAIDGGTTPLQVVEHFPPGLRATVVTHSLPVLQALARRPEIELIAIGGRVLSESMVTTGPVTVDAYRTINADLCILGVAGVDVTAGLTALNHDEALVKRAMIEGAAQIVAVAAADKLATAAPFAVVPINRLTHLVTDHAASPSLLKPFADAGLEVITA
jgi:DeoR/GlpR family transcriptional regulator of sugar metabolism